MTPTARGLENEQAECCVSLIDAPLEDADAEVLARRYAALSDPVRLKLLSLIAASGEMCSCDFLEPLGKSQPTVSHHTRILADAGLITGDKRGRWVYWRVEPIQADFVRQILGSWADHLGPSTSDRHPSRGPQPQA